MRKNPVRRKQPRPPLPPEERTAPDYPVKPPPSLISSRIYLVQLLLPRYDEAVVRELTERFGGMTAYARAPAKGEWKPAPGTTVHDDIVVYEVMADALDRVWWGGYRKELERRFDQKELVVRAYGIERL
jgi:hypothetical protein